MGKTSIFKIKKRDDVKQELFFLWLSDVDDENADIAIFPWKRQRVFFIRNIYRWCVNYIGKLTEEQNWWLFRIPQNLEALSFFLER